MTTVYTTFILDHGFRILGILVGALVLTWSVSLVQRKIFSILSQIAPQAVRDEDQRIRTMSRLVASIASIVIFLVTVLMILRELDIDTGPILASAGIAGIMVSLGAQAFLKDIIAGVIILVEGQYVEGEEVRLNDVRGIVRHISLRKTMLEDKTGARHSIPNGEIKIVSVFSKNKGKKV